MAASDWLVFPADVHFFAINEFAGKEIFYCQINQPTRVATTRTLWEITLINSFSPRYKHNVTYDTIGFLSLHYCGKFTRIRNLQAFFLSSWALPPIKIETRLPMCVLVFMCRSCTSLSNWECFVSSGESCRQRLQTPCGIDENRILNLFFPNFALFPLGLSNIVKTNWGRCSGNELYIFQL